MSGFENLDAVSEYIAANGESEDVKAFLSNYEKTTEINKDAVLSFLDTKDGVPIKQSIQDKATAEAIEKFKESQLPDIVENEIIKRNPPKSEAEKRILAMETELANERAERMREKLLNGTIKYFSENEALKGHEKYASAFADLAVSGSEKATITKRELLASLLGDISAEIKSSYIASLAHKPSSGNVQKSMCDIDSQIASLEKKRIEQPGNVQDLVALNNLYREKEKQTNEV